MFTLIEMKHLSRTLKSVQQMKIEDVMTGWFSQVEYQVLQLLEVCPQLREPLGVFAEARGQIWPHSLNAETWETMQQAAAELASAVDKLCDISIILCSLPTRYGTCGHGLTDEGKCLKDWHITYSSSESELPLVD